MCCLRYSDHLINLVDALLKIDTELNLELFVRLRINNHNRTTLYMLTAYGHKKIILV